VLRICNLSARRADELETETTDSVGLLGRSIVGGGPEMIVCECVEGGGCIGEEDEPRLSVLGGNEAVEPLIFANRRRKSSKGAPVPPYSRLPIRPVREIRLGVSRVGWRGESTWDDRCVASRPCATYALNGVNLPVGGVPISIKTGSTV
jgi:hypothetical protein